MNIAEFDTLSHHFKDLLVTDVGCKGLKLQFMIIKYNQFWIGNKNNKNRDARHFSQFIYAEDCHIEMSVYIFEITTSYRINRTSNIRLF